MYADTLEKSRQIQTVATMTGEYTTPFVAKLSTLEDDRETYIQTMEDRIDSVLGTVLAKALNKSNATPTQMFFNQSMAENVEGGTNGSVQIM